MTGAPSTRISWRGLAKLSGVVIRAAAATSACFTAGGDAPASSSSGLIEVGRSHELPEADRGSVAAGTWSAGTSAGRDMPADQAGTKS